ncbi:hypothetical protein OQA88_13639 [Cercophora sp. LCS_1]
MADYDVLIVGAGPVGMALALELARQHVTFRIIEKAPVRSDKSRALVVQPRTLELLNRYGDAHALVSRGQPVRATATVINRKVVTRIVLDDLIPPDTEFPLPLGLGQPETERFLEECLSEYGVKVERLIAATEIVHDTTGVTTMLEGPGSTTTRVRTKYIVGCDGAHSFVRHAAANLTFEGAQYQQDFLLCDARLQNSNLPRDRFNMCFGNGALAVFPLNSGLSRVVYMGAQVTSAEEPTLELMQSLFDQFTPPGSGTLSDPAWLTRFRLHHRNVNSYRDGRIFVAGDAAHIHSPAGGQGMNTGIQDAINLGWKLAAVLQDRTDDPEALLDSYDAERRRVGEHLVSGTDRLFSFIANASWLFVQLRNLIMPWVLPYIVASRDRRLKFFRFMSEFALTYRKSPIVGMAKDFSGPVGGGDRLPDGKLTDIKSQAETSMQKICGGASHALVLFSGTVEGDSATTADLRAAYERVSKLMRDKLVPNYVFSGSRGAADRVEDSYHDPEGTIHERFGFTAPGYILVRPDSYIAHIGPLSQMDELLEFLKS